MIDTVKRELFVEAPVERVWKAVLADGWLADEVELDLRPGGEARFRTEQSEKRGWVEDVREPAADAPAHLIFWWADGDEPATRVELQLLAGDGRTCVRVSESRPLEVLDAVGVPLPGIGGVGYGPALVAV